MSYNWQSAATAEGRERLEELLDRRKPVIGKVHGQLTEFFIGKYEGLITTEYYNIGGQYHYDKLDESLLHGVEFLDPDQDNQIAALKAENEQLLKACQDSAGKEIVDNVLHDRQVSELLAEIDRLKKLL